MNRPHIFGQGTPSILTAASAPAASELQARPTARRMDR